MLLVSGVLQRGAQTIDLLRDFSRQSLAAPPTEPIDINAIADEALQLCRVRVAQHPTRIDLRKDFGDVSPVRVSAAELLSAVVNLIVNAMDALPKGGTITVRTGYSNVGPWLEVEDDGMGMPSDVARRAFEPFFTTKGEVGTGLGLAMVYAFMTRHGGGVRLRTEAGAGTTVALTFDAP